LIEINNIKKSFKKQRVLRGVCLTCEPGKIQALLGANGAGKSTLINIISALIKCDLGKFCIDGEEITLNKYKYRIKVGYVFERPIYIDHLSAKEYLTFVAKMYELPSKEYPIKIDELLSFFELPEDNHKHIESYSKGMKSKVSLAAALIHNPKYLILDEPFDGLDFMSVQKISNLFSLLTMKGTTILITSHQFDAIAEMCHMFALLKDGKIMFNSDFSQLKKMASDFNHTKNPVKSYLESIMSNNKNQNLSWV
jgi:ABC-2 type transport system ATP-binding protein